MQIRLHLKREVKIHEDFKSLSSFVSTLSTVDKTRTFFAEFVLSAVGLLKVVQEMEVKKQREILEEEKREKEKREHRAMVDKREAERGSSSSTVKVSPSQLDNSSSSSSSSIRQFPSPLSPTQSIGKLLTLLCLLLAAPLSLSSASFSALCGLDGLCNIGVTLLEEDSSSVLTHIFPLVSHTLIKHSKDEWTQIESPSLSALCILLLGYSPVQFHTFIGKDMSVRPYIYSEALKCQRRHSTGLLQPAVARIFTCDSLSTKPYLNAMKGILKSIMNGMKIGCDQGVRAKLSSLLLKVIQFSCECINLEACVRVNSASLPILRVLMNGIPPLCAWRAGKLCGRVRSNLLDTIYVCFGVQRLWDEHEKDDRSEYIPVDIGYCSDVIGVLRGGMDDEEDKVRTSVIRLSGQIFSMFNGVNMKHLVELQKQQDQLELPKMDTSHEEKDEEEVDVIEEKDEDEDVIDFRKSISPSAFSSLLSSLFLGVSNRLADSTSSNASLAANVLCSFPLLLACPSDLCSVSSILSLHIDDERESVPLIMRAFSHIFLTDVFQHACFLMIIGFRKSISPSAFSSLLSSLFLGVSNRLADSTSSNASLAANVLCSFPLLLACPSDLCSVSSILSLHIDDERESVRLACRDTLVSFITLLGHPLNSVDYESILTHLPHGCVPTCMLLDDYWIPVMDAKRKELFAECIKEYEKRKVKARNTKAIETIDAVIARYSSK
ncbi:hypothetical protein ADUPG1_007745 [Aduncisulcus paluster]|uniref:Uncharacterized protein n=1 Tax=Aduncisulcus paluster TaxID=2918883 RepID=A0ABQ5KPD5_9EUKA|nr:hypothetical protein ADUPG1_007745 [Aduncisulcus paluster]